MIATDDFGKRPLFMRWSAIAKVTRVSNFPFGTDIRTRLNDFQDLLTIFEIRQHTTNTVGFFSRILKLTQCLDN
jgi:hypothetical protein